jgi:hypothetical protein
MVYLHNANSFETGLVEKKPGGGGSDRAGQFF